MKNNPAMFFIIFPDQTVNDVKEGRVRKKLVKRQLPKFEEKAYLFDRVLAIGRWMAGKRNTT